ncbi:PolC-type DNA polymerase III [Candidatus Phytoplasma meliae]|uniref:DNA polymerase III PolC-type n=1 Tax=Candidatus Phytoplasma meliae TaxID=1848402 RepID=A0ABS5CY67_9MOLU|nr:PolC-type DNA polymerase III [Candidatus Phytoplasma meliae]MBP5835922.1 PolC-type DNA polymerase III [Candidatus Phytoplasma meliae]
MFINAFEQFIKEKGFDKNYFQKPQLKKVFILANENTWRLHITFQHLLLISDLSTFLEKLTQFLQTKYQKKAQEIVGVKSIDIKNINIEYYLNFEKLDYLTSLGPSYYRYMISQAKLKEKYLDLDFFDYDNYQISFCDEQFIITVDSESFWVAKEKIPFLKDFLARFYGLKNKVVIKKNDQITPISKNQLSYHINKLKDNQQETFASPKEAKNEFNMESPNKYQKSFNNAKNYQIKDLPKNEQELKEFKEQNPNTNIILQGYLSQDIKEINFRKYSKYKENQYFFFSCVLEENHGFSIEDRDAILVKKIVTKPEKEHLLHQNLQTGQLFKIKAKMKHSVWDDVHLMIQEYEILSSNKTLFPIRQDHGIQGEKRIEFHVHTKMSNLDAINSAKEYLQIAESWGHKAIAFTDHSGIYAYPEIYKFSKNKKIKPVYGLEIDFIEEKPLYITNQVEDNLTYDFNLQEATYVVFDLETTGFSSIRDKIIEIAGVKIHRGQKIAEFEAFIDPQEKLTPTIINITNITDEMLAGQQTIDQVLPNFLKFIENCVLVAHNSKFDMTFLKEKMKELNLAFKPQPVIDTMGLSQSYFSKFLKYFTLKRLAQVFKVKMESHHRALSDAKATAEVFIKMIDQLSDPKKDPQNLVITNFFDLQDPVDPKYERPYHINILVANQKGYRHLFELLSNALTDNFHKIPRVSKSVLAKYREGLLVGSGCYNSNIFEIALNSNIDNLKQAISFYDYIEVQPPQAYKHLIHELGLKGQQIIETTLIKIIEETKKQGKLIIATGDVHYLHPWEKDYREIYISAKLVGGGLHKLSKYSNHYLPDNHLLTTAEMFDAFKFLQNNDLAYEITIGNTHLLNDKIERVEAFNDKLLSLQDNTFEHTLKIPSIKKEIKKLVMAKVKQLYGRKPHPLIKKRLQQELKSILGDDNNPTSNQKIAPIYYLSHLLVKKSLEDGYLVGSRGSIGSSLVATMLEITEINPLKPHYRCPRCCYTIMKMKPEEKTKYGNPKDQSYYESLDKVFSGYDLENRECPECQTVFQKDGHDIPFETFLGFEGNKTPDIDLNFAGDYQSQAHNYIKYLIGENYAFRAGTIQTIANRNAYGYVMGFLENKSFKWRKHKISQIANKIEGVKRSTGQHPGGIVIVPPGHSIYEITPIQYPANDTSSQWKTTHFDYHSFEQNLFKLDILGHDDPMMIKFLMDYVKQDPNDFPFRKAQDIPLDDPQVYELFSNDFKDNNIIVDSLGIPEFGTFFVKQMLKDIKSIKNNDETPIKINFAALVKISGLSHGTDVWHQNAKDAINKTGDFKKYQDENISFNDIIGCRDDIMLQLQEKGIKPLKAFNIMEFIRKGQPQNDFKTWQIYQKEMQGIIEDWYMESAFRIKYLFPKAHATAYVIMALRIAWFKVHKPLLFYSGYFSKRTEHFDHQTMVSNDVSLIEEEIEKLNKLKTSKKIKAKDEILINTLKITKEMLQRGFKFLSVDFNKSDISIFKIENNNYLRMPLLALDGLGKIAANKIIEARKEKPFTKDDFRIRSKINKTIFEQITKEHLLDSL